MTAVCDQPSISAAITISRTSLCSPIMMDMFSMIRVDLRLDMKTSYRLCRTLCERRQRHIDYRIDCMQSGLFIQFFECAG